MRDFALEEPFYCRARTDTVSMEHDALLLKVPSGWNIILVRQKHFSLTGVRCRINLFLPTLRPDGTIAVVPDFVSHR